MWTGQATVSPLDLTLSEMRDHWTVWKQERPPAEETPVAGCSVPNRPKEGGEDAGRETS